MQPGLGRAIPMGVFGFLLGFFIVLVLRAIQGLTPVWSFGPAMVVAAFVSTGFFVWGMGAFDPRMSVHGDHHDEAETDDEDAVEESDENEGRSSLWILTNYVWVSTFGLIVILLIIAIFAFGPGPIHLGLQTADVAEGSVVDVGTTTLSLFGKEYVLSQGALFVIFAVWAVFSLALFGGLIALIFWLLSRGIKETEGTPSVEDRTPPHIVYLTLTLPIRFVINLLNKVPQLLGQR
ncbi:MAG: hypothetical protein D6737_18495 [Chloroflexi bacterium]|nr:MAG: hypothetical protein D6737_18495 [Chloroflexota bacterium]